MFRENPRFPALPSGADITSWRWQRSVGRPGLDADEEDAVYESLWCRMLATEIPGTV